MSPRPTIAFITDFGFDSPYVAQMKCVARAIHPEIDFLDITHSVPPQDIQHASIVVDQMFDFLPKATCLVAVVDPGVGSARRILAAHTDGIFVTAPDNGLLCELFRRKSFNDIVHVTETAYWQNTVSPTFHGRDIMTPVAAHLLAGLRLEKLGSPVGQIEELKIPIPVAQGRSIQGEILYADSFGNLITNISRKFFFDRVSQQDRHAAVVSAANFEIGSILETYSNASSGSVISLFGSNDKLEIAKVEGNLLQDGRWSIRDSVAIEW